MGGTITPGDAGGPLVLAIQGNYTQSFTGTFLTELQGHGFGQYNQLAVAGSATLDGTLEVVLLNGLVVNLGDTYVLMTFANESGQFSTLDLPILPIGEDWLLSYNSNDITLSVVTETPEPASIILLASGLISAAVAFRRSRV